MYFELIKYHLEKNSDDKTWPRRANDNSITGWNTYLSTVFLGHIHLNVNRIQYYSQDTA